MILEKETFPRFHIGESLLPAGNAMLARAGVLERVEAAGFIRKYGARFTNPSGLRSKRIRFVDALDPVAPYTFQVERSRYDSLLLDHARSLGATVRHAVQVQCFEEDDAGVTVHATGIDAPLRARWLLDGSGRGCVALRQWKTLRKPLRGFGKRVAIYTHMLDIPRGPGELGGDTIAVRFDDGWCWLIPLDERKTSVGLVLDSGSMESGVAPSDIFFKRLHRSPYLRRLMESAGQAEEIRVTADYSYLHRSPTTSSRVLTMGDAFGFLDPIFSSGVHMAQSAGMDAADLVLRLLERERGATEGERRIYERRLERRAAAFRALIEAFYDPDGFEVFLEPGRLFNIADAVTNIVAGDTDCSWDVRWRYWLFLGFCRLQRHYPVVGGHRAR